MSVPPIERYGNKVMYLTNELVDGEFREELWVDGILYTYWWHYDLIRMSGPVAINGRLRLETASMLVPRWIRKVLARTDERMDKAAAERRRPKETIAL